MKTRKPTVLLGFLPALLLLFIFSVNAFSQDLVQEKIVTLSKKAQINKLAHIQFNDDQSFALYYVTKAKKDYAKIETYFVDRDFNLANSDVTEITFNDVKSKYPWWKYSGESVVIKGLYIEPKDNLIVKKRQLTGKFNWVTLSYMYKTKILQKVKIRNEEGDRYFLIKYFMDDKRGCAYVLAGVKDRSNKNSQWTDIHFMKINENIDIEKNIPLNLSFPVDLKASKAITDSEDGLANWLFLMQDKGQSGKSILFNFSGDCDIVDRIEFDVKDPSWKVEDLLMDNNTGAVCAFGPSGKGSFQNLKFAGHNLVYNTITPFSEFKEKFRKPPSQPKGDPYSGKTFFIDGATFLDDGSLVIMGQNWDLGGASNVLSAISGSPEDIKIRYMDSFLFQYNPAGDFIGQYCYYTKDKGWSNEHPNSQVILPGTSGKYYYWLVMPVAQFGFRHHPTMISKINKEGSSMEEFKVINDFKGEKGIFFHDYEHPWFKASDGSIIFFGSVLPAPTSYKTNKVWFSKFRLE